MEDLRGQIPCSSLAVHSAIQIEILSIAIRNGIIVVKNNFPVFTQAGGIWGSCLGPHQARRRGFTGTAQAFFVAKSIGKSSFQCGLIGGVCALTHCGVQRYRRKNDWVNALVGGAAAGTVVAAGAVVITRNRNWRRVAGIAGLVAIFSAAADYSKTFSSVS